MKTFLLAAAAAFAFVTPAAAQPAQQGHAQHQGGSAQHGQHAMHGQGGGHGQHCNCCADANNNGRMDCCEGAAGAQHRQHGQAGQQPAPAQPQQR